MKRYVRITEAVGIGVTKEEILQIYHTPGQTMVRKISPEKPNSPLLVDLEQLEEHIKQKAQESTLVAQRRMGRVV